jgi:hypothetical protein
MPAIGWAGPNPRADQLDERKSFSYKIQDPKPTLNISGQQSENLANFHTLSNTIDPSAEFAGGTSH